jgi:hypothetical protein
VVRARASSDQGDVETAALADFHPERVMTALRSG